MINKKKSGKSYSYKNHRIIWLILSILLVLSCAGIFVYSKVLNAQDSYSETYVKYESDLRNHAPKKVLAKEKPLSFLLLGVDQRENDPGRSDTMIVMTVNPETGLATTMSIPRDAYVPIAGDNHLDKINHAYAVGGIETSAKTVEHVFNIPIDYVVAINMEGLQNLMTITGDIEVENRTAFTVGTNSFPKGKVTLNADNILDYVKMRKEDKDGDFGRQNRQRAVLLAMFKQLQDTNALKNVDNLLTVMKHNMETNIPISDMNAIRKNYLGNIDDMKKLSLYEGKNVKIKGVYYYKMDKKNVEKNIEILRKQLNLTNEQ